MSLPLHFTFEAEFGRLDPLCVVPSPNFTRCRAERATAQSREREITSSSLPLSPLRFPSSYFNVNEIVERAAISVHRLRIIHPYLLLPFLTIDYRIL